MSAPDAGGDPRSPARERRDVGVPAKTADRVVELPDAGEPGGEGDVGERQSGGLDQQPGGLGPLGAGQGEGPGADLG